jgi:hypothetical protein
VGKWTALLAERAAENSPAPHLAGTDRTDEWGLLSVMAVGSGGGSAEIRGSEASNGQAQVDPDGQARPFRLSEDEADGAHAGPWDDAAISTFTQRVVLFLRRGINATDADDLAERLRLRDLQGDDRRLCLECRHLAGRRCGNHCAAGVGRDLPEELVMQPQRCPGFDAKES